MSSCEESTKDSRHQQTTVAKPNEAETNLNNNSNDSLFEGDTCVVCFKNVEIYSIGECDHPVCHECSTRMRVLCQQNECPICRQVLGKVIFTYDKLPYRELETKNRSEYYSKRYKIGFYNNDIQKRFFELLDHPCPKCNTLPYRSFQGLRDHVRKEHNLFYCDLCVDNLKIFTFERRCYTQAELGLHRTKGDVDNKSHRGHPLCEYCNKRFLDRDELFRHLRREHYFCHFCDADGCNQFYRDYDALAEHFRQDHYLCEEGKCATEQFVGAFRTEIDYKAHVASVHGKTLNKQQAKQTRTLQLEITLGPRGRGGQSEQTVTNIRRSDEPHPREDIEPSYVQHQTQRPKTIDSQNEQDFPSLGGTSGGTSAASAPLIPFPMRRGLPSGLARTKENFPALGNSNSNIGSTSSAQQQQNHQQGPPISAMLKRTTNTTTNARPSTAQSTTTNNGSVNNSSMVIHVSNRPPGNSINNGAISKKAATPNMDFPALPVSSSASLFAKNSKKQPTAPKGQINQNSQPLQQQPQQPQQQQHHPQHHQQQQRTTTRLLEEDMLPSSSSNVPLGSVAAKYRPLVDDYVSVANPKNFQKLQMVQNAENAEAQSTKKSMEQRVKSAPKLDSGDFPSLSGNNSNSNSSNVTSSNTSSNWVKSGSEKKQRELENRKSKVAPAPLSSTSSAVKEGKSVINKSSSNDSASQKEKKPKDKKSESVKSKDKLISNSSSSSSHSHSNSNSNSNNNNNEKKSNQKNPNSNMISNNNGNNNITLLHDSNDLRPPPGFIKSKSGENSTANPTINVPPPGFLSNVTVNSVAKSPNNLTFTSSMGESYSIIPKHKYSQPPDSLARNQQLVDDFQNVMGSREAFMQFHLISQKFRENFYKADAFYEHCQAALKDKFDSLFPELLALLPDISKQQELYLVHVQRLNNTMSPAERKLMPQLEVCPACKQVLLSKDSAEHKKLHEYPAIGKASSAAAGKRK